MGGSGSACAMTIDPGTRSSNPQTDPLPDGHARIRHIATPRSALVGDAPSVLRHLQACGLLPLLPDAERACGDRGHRRSEAGASARARWEGVARAPRLGGRRTLAHRADEPARPGRRAGDRRAAGAPRPRHLTVPAALDHLRVLEVGDLVSAPYATKLLADLGADVVKIERPGGGDLARQRGPFLGGASHPEKSGLFLYLNANKRGITLDLGHPRGQEAFGRLVARADLLVHNVHPTEMAAAGLDYERLAALNPRLVMATIAPFGVTGPHATYRGTDVVM